MGAVQKWKALAPWSKHLAWGMLATSFSMPLTMWITRLSPRVGFPLVMLMHAVLLSQFVVRQTVEVGTDGVAVRWLGRRRFVRFDGIASATMTPFGVTLKLTTGDELDLRLSPGAHGEARKTKAMFDAIEAGREGIAALASQHDEALLARGSRDHAKWTEDLRALATATNAGYRTPAIPVERLWKVLENPAADPSAREGAAIALDATLDDEGRARIRAIAEGTASPGLRVVLDEIAHEEAQEEAEEERRQKR